MPARVSADGDAEEAVDDVEDYVGGGFAAGNAGAVVGPVGCLAVLADEGKFELAVAAKSVVVNPHATAVIKLYFLLRIGEGAK